MKILILTPQSPYPPHQGTSLRNYHIVRGLADKHRVDLLSYRPKDAPQETPAPLGALCHSVRFVDEPLRSGLQRLRQMATSSLPDMAQRLRSSEYGAALGQMLKETAYDIVQIEGIELAWTEPIVRELAAQARIVYDAHNAEALLQGRAGRADRQSISRWPAAVYSLVQSGRLATYEAWICQNADWVTAVSEPDAAALARLAPTMVERITIIPNCIETADYYPAQAQHSDFEYDVIFSGKMDYRPNVDAVLWFADAIWPMVRSVLPDARWVIAGQQPHARLDVLRDRPEITLTGWVPDMRPYLHDSAVVIMPFRVGSGTRLKLIEALAAGKGVVSTPLGVEGFPVHHGRELLIADSPTAFAEHVISLRNDDKLRIELGTRGLAFAQQYDWRNLIPRFESVYEALLHT